MANVHTFFERDDILVTCPYNNSHQVSKNKMAFHLNRCQRSHDTTGKNICPFNRSHIVDQCAYTYHIENCPDKANLETHKYNVGGEVDKLNVMPVQNTDIPCDESWDDVDTPTYNPLKRIEEDATLLVCKKGVIPSERKKYTRERKKKFNALNSPKRENILYGECGINAPHYAPETAPFHMHKSDTASASFTLPTSYASSVEQRSKTYKMERPDFQLGRPYTDSAGPMSYEPKSYTASASLALPRSHANSARPNTTNDEDYPNFQLLRSAVEACSGGYEKPKPSSMAWTVIKKEPGDVKRTTLLYDEGDGSECGSSPPRTNTPHDYKATGIGRGRRWEN